MICHPCRMDCLTQRTAPVEARRPLTQPASRRERKMIPQSPKPTDIRPTLLRLRGIVGPPVGTGLAPVSENAHGKRSTQTRFLSKVHVSLAGWSPISLSNGVPRPTRKIVNLHSRRVRRTVATKDRVKRSEVLPWNAWVAPIDLGPQYAVALRRREMNPPFGPLILNRQPRLHRPPINRLT